MPNPGSMDWFTAVETLLGGKEAVRQAFQSGQASGGGSPQVHRYQFDASILSELVAGDVAFTPTIGDILLDAWIDVDETWNGTTPQADIGTDEFFALEGNFGMFAQYGQAAVALSAAPSDAGGFLAQNYGSDNVPLSFTNVNLHVSPTQVGRTLPFRFTATDPIKLVVTQDGFFGGANPGSTVGQASLYVVTATPLDSRMH